MRVHSPRALLPRGSPHVLALAPLWGRVTPTPWPEPSFADDLVHSDVFVAEDDPAAADVAIFPEDWKHAQQAPDGRARAEALLDRARTAGTPAAFFWASDATGPFPWRDAYVFRPSLFRSRRRRREFGLPGFHEDLVQRVEGLPVRRWRSTPTVGFCGYAVADPRPAGLLARGRRLVGDARRSLAVRAGLPLRADIFVRQAALARLDGATEVRSNLVVRDEYNGVETADDPVRWHALREEYVANMLESDYVLCVRGHGNYSYRFYEALCLGRIPVFVDTDCVLPYDFAIDWASHGLWLRRTDVPVLPQRIAAYHAALGPERFEELQHANRRLWKEWLSPFGFFSHFALHFAHTNVTNSLRF